MRFIPKWVNTVQDSDKVAQSIYDLCFKPDGTELIVASGNRVIVYDATSGRLVRALKGHKDAVYSVCYSKNGEKFASGSADKCVIVWSNKLEGLLKYNHSDAVQCLAFNPLTHQLVSCSLTDFAFWSTEQKAVQKHKVGARINACSWSADGQFLALGLGNGVVSVRNKLGEEKYRIERPDNPPIWALSWDTSQEDQYITLCVTDWNKTLSFYNLTGKLLGKERNIGFNALKVRYFPTDSYILICGTNKRCIMYTKEGIRLGNVGEEGSSWVWCCEVDPTGKFVVIGNNDGTVAFYELIFSVVHGLYKERYAFRDHMTDIIIHHLLTEKKVRIKCRDFVKKIAIYKNRLAVQLLERVVIYELVSADDEDEMVYRSMEKISRSMECSLLVVCANHLVVCDEQIVQSLFFSGKRDNEWVFESAIRYIKVVGGPPGKEHLILGLRNGQVWEIHLDNSFPLLRVSLKDSIKCLDLSQSKRKLAVVDETNRCSIFDVDTGKLLSTEPEANCVAYNDKFEDMLVYSANNFMSVKVLDFPVYRQKLQGFVVGLTGSKLFYLKKGTSMATMELPLGGSLRLYTERNMFGEAYKLACFGVLDEDVEELATKALEHLHLETAKLAYARLGDYNNLELVKELQDRIAKGDHNKEGMLADIYARRGKFKEAAQLYQKAGQESKALAMYTDLRMFHLAQNYLDSSDNNTLIRQKADWAKTVREYKAAVEMYLSVGDVQAAIDIMGEQGWTDQLLDLGRRLDKTDRTALTVIAEHLKRLNDTAGAAEIYRRMGDSASVLSLHVEAKEWDQAFHMVEGQPQLKHLVYIPYARWLAENDKFVQAQKAYHMAGSLDEAFMVLKQLTENAISELRYEDAGYYYWIQARQCLDLARERPEEYSGMLEKFALNERLAGIYYAYHVLHRYLEEPFTSFMPEALFNIARFVMSQMNGLNPKGVSNFTVIYCFAKQARVLGANKLAKHLVNKLQNVRIPLKFQEQAEILTVTSKARPHSDPEELLPMCYRCSTYNPLTTFSDKCANCGQKFVYSYVSFEILPLVEFVLEDGITDIEAVRLIETPAEIDKAKKAESDGWKQELSDTHQMLRLDDEVKEDPFAGKLLNYEGCDGSFVPIAVNRQALLQMDTTSVLIYKWHHPMRYRYFKNLLPDLQITVCQFCFKVFHADDFEHQVLQKGYCPFCRTAPEAEDGGDVVDDLFSNN